MTVENVPAKRCSPRAVKRVVACRWYILALTSGGPAAVTTATLINIINVTATVALVPNDNIVNARLWQNGNADTVYVLMLLRLIFF